MQTHLHIGKLSLMQAKHGMKAGIVAALALLTIAVTLSINVTGAKASSSCSSSDHRYVVAGGDTLGNIAARYKQSALTLASHNHIANPNLIHRSQVICIPGSRSVGKSSHTAPLHASSANISVRGSVASYGNPFPYPACTWWADQRYYQMHGIYVPWRINANAWQWTARAYQFGWHVSSRASVGSIVDMQPWVQGAYGAGHVAVVERVLGNGSVIASSMSWGANPYAVVYIQVHPGSGITFIRR